jgi:hypothetical protein
MKLASFAFCLLLLHAHGAGDFDELLGQPLSMFRDGAQGRLGYALFAVLLVIGALYTAALVRAQRAGAAAAAVLAILLLLVVAATPSGGSFHLFCSLVLLLLLFGHCALLLYRAQSVWLVPHLAVPAALAAATRCHSYGLWQKGFVVYLLLAVATHHHLLGRGPTSRASPPADPYVRRRGEPTRRRKVYRLEAGREWARRDVVRS